MAVQEATGETPQDLIAPEFPEGAGYLWEWFLQLHRRRSVGNGFCSERITWETLDAWNRLSRNDAQPWELNLIGDIDDAYMRRQAEATKTRGAKP